MNIPFPFILPPIISPDWFNPDRPVDEDAELTFLENQNKEWLKSFSTMQMKLPTYRIGKPPTANAAQPPAREDAGSDDDVFIVSANDDVDESTSQDVDEDLPGMETVDVITISDSPEIISDDESETSEESLPETVIIEAAPLPMPVDDDENNE